MSARLVVIVALVLGASACARSHRIGVDAAIDLGPPATGVLARCATDTSGFSRDCGWDRGPSFSCTPGAMVEAACNAECRLGSCTGDSMIRICAGENPCTGASAITQDDDSCSTLCPQTQFRCPPGGRYTVLTGSFGSMRPYSCSISVR